MFLPHDPLNHLTSGKPQRKPRKFTDPRSKPLERFKARLGKASKYFYSSLFKTKYLSGDFSDESWTLCGNYLTVFDPEKEILEYGYAKKKKQLFVAALL